MMIGKKILHYEIIKELGRGGMGVVYLAEDTKLDRLVAIKFLPAAVARKSKDRIRFVREAKAAASLNHPHIATIHAIEESDDEMFIVMEYIEGKELKDVIKSEIPDLKSAIQYAIQIAEGLQAAHAKGIVHRDIKSSNIMITTEGQVKIMDFGLAKVGAGTQLTKEYTTIGTAGYMSPEQVKGEKVDQRSDIWAFGVLLYELLTGRLPFSGEYEQALMYCIVNEKPEPVSQARVDIPFFLEEIVNQCLIKDPDQRYQTMSEVLADLKSGGVRSTSDPTTAIEVKIPISRSGIQLNPGKIFLAVIIFVLLILAGFFMKSGSIILTNLFHPGTTLPEQHLLVLPIINIGGDVNRQVFCDGLMETLTSELTQLEQFHGSLWVIPASEVRRNNMESPSEANKKFGVNLVVSGSLQQINNQLRLTLNLVDAKNLRQLNSTVIDVKKSNLSALQDESVTNLLEMLNLEFNPEAKTILQAGGTTVPGAYEFYLQGRGYLLRYEKTENIDAAIDLFKHAITLDSVYALAYAGLGEAYWLKYEALRNTKFVNEAIAACEHAFKLNNQLAPVNITLGLIHSGTGRYQEAIQNFNQALEADPTNADAYRGLAKAYEAQKLLEKAEVTYKRSIKLKPDYWAGYNELGAFYYRHERYKEAIIQFQQVVALTPDNYRGYNNLGAIYYLLERWADARQMFEKSFSLNNSYSTASNLGTLYYIEGQYSQAARMYRKALAINNADYVIWGNLAAAYYWIPGKREQAGQYFQHAIELGEKQRKVNPNDAEVLSQLAGFYAMIGNKKKALLLVDESLKISPNDAQVMYHTGTTYEQLGDREQAIDWIVKAIENGYSKSEIEHQPELRKLLADVRFKELLKNKTGHQGKRSD
jgi:serine/threonine protein kinase/tetratricopeptide (TPR) repeat protein